MPLFYQHNINENTKLAVWHITENENFFLEKVPFKLPFLILIRDCNISPRGIFWKLLQPGFPFHMIEIADSKKPLLVDDEFHFSVSHCGDFAAAIVSENKQVGIDVELVTPKVERIKNKFLNQG